MEGKEYVKIKNGILILYFNFPNKSNPVLKNIEIIYFIEYVILLLGTTLIILLTTS